MSSKQGCELAGWALIAYIAAVVQIAFCPDAGGPHCVLALAAWWLCRHPGPRGVLWVALSGLLLDAVGNGRLGLHLGTCGMLAALATSALSSGMTARWWVRPVIAAWLAFGDAAVSATLLSLTTPAPLDLSTVLRDAGVSALWTAVLVAEVGLSGTLVSRCLAPQVSAPSVRLSNRWNRLSEA
ncbi:MAG TPA: hypothetical protein VM165_07360 [Planctomycetaceae bacterium]|nr:hypothetical protein [Planctomycetaceae bacterium]